jgi:hypothetical protein
MPLNSSRALSRAFRPISLALESTSAKARMCRLPLSAASLRALRTLGRIHFSL